jgi:dipeptidyl aminopeptidase/acylaminoacyl peptidase
MHRNALYSLAVPLLFPLAALAQAKRPLDHDAYEIWKTIENESVSNDGRWMLYSLELQDGDSELKVHGLRSDVTYAIPRAKAAQFTHDSRFVVALVAPQQALVKQAKREEKTSDEQPKDSLAVLDLATGEFFHAEDVRSFRLPQEAGGWVAYLLEEDEQVQQEEQQDEQEGEGKTKDKEVGTVLVLRNLAAGSEVRYEVVTEYAFTRQGRWLAYTTSSRDGSADGAFVVDLETGSGSGILTGEGSYKSLTFAESGDQLAFLSNRDDYEADQPAFSLYHWRSGADTANALVSEGATGLPEGWWVSEHGEPSFSKNGARLFFASAPRPEPAVEDSTLDEDRVEVEIWHWKDPLLQPMQALQVGNERTRAYRAVAHLAEGVVVQLATEDVPDIDLVQQGNADFVLGTSGLPYRQLISWDSPAYQDVYTINVHTGESRVLREKLQGDANVSPGGKYVFWWNNVELAWYAHATDDDRVINMTADLPHPTHNEDHDWPYLPNAYGTAGWTDGDEEFLVYDRYDIWAVDPDGQSAPRNVTDGLGRRDSLQFRYVKLDPEVRSIAPGEPMLLRAFNRRTKAAGFYRDRVRGDRQPRELMYADRRFSNLTKAKDANVLMFARQSVEEFPDLWVSNTDFRGTRKMSNANPQQSEYRWATAELVEWYSVDGIPLQGLLYKPSDFDPSQKYPMIVTFYEKDSDNLHAHHPPIPHRSVVRPTFYASRGYVVFVPDIVYQVGYPGESATDCIVPGVLELGTVGAGIRSPTW